MKFCTSCGCKLADNEKFCPSCGTAARNPEDFSDEEKNNSNAVPVNSKSVETETYSPKSRTAALLLTIFFGPFGFHNFYLGRGIQGFLQFASSVIFIICICRGITTDNDSSYIMIALAYIPFLIASIVAFVDLIKIAAGSKKDGNGIYVKYWNPDEIFNERVDTEIVEDKVNENEGCDENWKKISSIHFEKIIDRTMDLNVINTIRNSYVERDGYYYVSDSIDNAAGALLSQHMQQCLDEILKFERLRNS